MQVARPVDDVAAPLAPEGDSKGDGFFNYGSGSRYWDDRYQKDPDTFEWLEGYKEMKDMIEMIAGDCRETCRILHVGCGNSVLTEEMYDAGYHQIINIDFSSTVIEQMIARNQKRPEMIWLEMDATHMELPDEAFDLVIDKSVTDTFACGENAPLTIATYLKELWRVLRPGGTLLAVSYGAPDSRRSHFTSPHLDWTLTELDFPKNLGVHYAYVCKKGASSAGFMAKWPEVQRSFGVDI